MDRYLHPDANYERLLKDHKLWGSITVGYDFDDTVYDYHGAGGTYELVRQLIRDLKEIGSTVICWTANKDIEFVIKFLTENNIPFDAINEDGIPLPYKCRKPFFSALLDDRAGLISAYNDLRRFVDTIKAENDNRIQTPGVPGSVL